eukprot:7427767-Pyramimonas_sp.AAC.1
MARARSMSRRSWAARDRPLSRAIVGGKIRWWAESLAACISAWPANDFCGWSRSRLALVAVVFGVWPRSGWRM